MKSTKVTINVPETAKEARKVYRLRRKSQRRSASVEKQIERELLKRDARRKNIKITY